LTVLSCPFFSGARPGRTLELIFTLYGSNDVFPCQEMPFGVRTMGDVIYEKYAPRPPKWAWMGNFKPKWQNIIIKIAISLKL